MPTSRPRKQPARPRPVRVVEDSWGMLLRDLLVRATALAVLAGAGLWALRLPAVQHLPGVARVTHAAEATVVQAVPAAGPLLGIAPPAVPPPPPRHHARPTPTPAPVAEAPTAAPVVVKEAAAMQPVAKPPVPATHGGAQHAVRTVAGVPLHVVTIDLNDPDVVGTLVLANGAARPNTADSTAGDEDFTAMAARTHAAVAINGTFFSKDAQKRVMGNMVRDGALIKFSQWDHDGTTFWLGPDNRPGMATAKADAPPPWNTAWLALSCGPRLVRHGQPWLQPATEGFHDSHVLGVAGRSALGFDAAGHKLFLVSFQAGVDLAHEAQVMRALGCYEAMNLDGGASRSLALGGEVVVPAGRALTNVLAFYDRKHPAPRALAEQFHKLRQGSGTI